MPEVRKVYRPPVQNSIPGVKLFLTFGLLLPALFTYPQEKLVKVNGHNFNVYLKGFENRKKNAPVLVFENGMGVGLGNWESIIGELSKVAPVFAYDRSGVEKSEKVYEMPTVKKVAENLKAILTSLKIPPPYILVGHSMGAVYVRGYAGFFPVDVAGLIFLDPADFTETKEDWNSIFRTLGVPEKKIEEMMLNRLYTKSEVDSAFFGPWSESEVLKELRKSDFSELVNLPVPVVPIHFLVGGKFEVPPDKRSKDFNHEEFFRVKNNRNMERWRDFIAKGKGGSLIYLPNCGHYLHWDDPKAIIYQIRYMVEGH